MSVSILGQFFTAIFAFWTQEAKEQKRARKEKRARRKQEKKDKALAIEKAKVAELRRKLLQGQADRDHEKRKKEFADHWKATYKPEDIDKNPYDEEE